MEPQRPSPAPGWYPDPSGEFEVRYWDGRAWTEHIAHPTRPGTHPPASPPPLAGLGQRLGGFLLDALLVVLTLGIGWLIWACFTFSQGQTPAKSILGMRVVDQDTGRAAAWSQMFLRNVVIGFGLSVLSAIAFGIPWLVAAGLIFGGDLRQTGWDRLAGTLVVSDPSGVTLPTPPGHPPGGEWGSDFSPGG